MATAEEKIDAYLASLSRDEMMERMYDSVENWDIASLVEHAQANIVDPMQSLSDKEFCDEYYEWFAYELDDMFEDDEEVTQPYGRPYLKPVCDEACALSAWGISHTDDCPDNPKNK